MKRCTSAMALFLLISQQACSEADHAPRIPFAGEAQTGLWEDVFVEEQVVPVPDSGEKKLVITQVLNDSRGDLVIPDSRNDRILILSPAGELIRCIGQDGPAAVQFSMLRTVALDSSDTLYAFDLDGKRMSILEAPEYAVSRGYVLDSVLASIIAADSGEVVAYCPTDPQVLAKFDRLGGTARRAFEPRREPVRIFLNRVQAGGVAGRLNGEGFYFIYPDDFAIYHFDDDLSLTRVIQSHPAPWRPRLSDFPSSLSPFDYKPAHKQWWDSQMHISSLFRPADGILAVTLYESNGMQAQAWFVNLYDENGGVISEGLPVPHQGRIVGATQGTVFVANDPFLAADGSLRPSVLRRYGLAQSALKSGVAEKSTQMEDFRPPGP